MTTEPFRPTIRTQADLQAAWQHLLQPLGFRDRSLWVMYLDEHDRPAPQLVEIAEVPERLDAEVLAGFADFVADAHDASHRVAVLLSRPGGSTLSPADRTWARDLYDAFRAAGVPAEVLHVATDTAVVPVPMDEVALPESA